MHGDFPTLSRFEYIRRLGAGAMGIVYEAYDFERASGVALKTLRLPNEGRHILRFKNEFRVLQDIRHTNLVQLFELIENEGQWFFTMELLDGVELLEHIRPASRPWTNLGPGTYGDDRTTEDALDTPRTALTQPFKGTFGGQSGEGSGEFDEARLRSDLKQLATGLMALHRAGKIHRDIKPSNIVVTNEGRVVLLDFGIAIPFDTPNATIAGTPLYMAPEQISLKPIGPAADWYAVGMILYEALTNRLPFEEGELLGQKLLGDFPSPRSITADLPADLDKLCTRLLATDPDARPSGTEFLEQLGAEPEIDDELHRDWMLSSEFIGRVAELAELDASLAITRSGSQRTILVCGESGVGKSELIRRFGHTISAQALVLRGRCHERESVPYKALDSVIDALSEHMVSLAGEDAAILVPRDASLLLRTFPVLRRVEVLGRAPFVDDTSMPPRMQRARVFESLRELLSRLAAEQSLVILVDDLQWADVDSLELIAALTRRPDAPALLFVATVRTGSDEEEKRRLYERLSVLGTEDHRLEIAPLVHADAANLARALMRRTAPGGNIAEIDPRLIAEEAGGHPLFIQELLRHSSQRPNREKRLRFEEALSARIERLEGSARHIVEVLAIAGRPLPQVIVARAASTDPDGFHRYVELLRAENLVRTAGARASDPIEIYHSRVAEVVRSMCSVRSAVVHKHLAIALEAAGRSDAETLSIHWRGAGDNARAGHFACVAAEEASTALAFDRAARLYQLAIELGLSEQAPLLYGRLGDALANAGRGAESAVAYTTAAASTSGAASVEFQQSAAGQLLRSGHIDDGIAAMTPLLASKGIRMPKTPAGSLVSFISRRILLSIVRPNFGFKPQKEAQIPTEALAHLDFLFSATRGLFTVDQIRGLDLHVRHLHLALRLGEPARVARALGLEAASLAAIGGSKRRMESLLERARQIALTAPDPYTDVWLEASSAAIAYLEGRWSEAYSRSGRATDLFRGRCKGVSWEIDSMRQIGAWSLCYLGRMDELELFARTGLGIGDAAERGDLYAALSTRSGFPNVAWLAKGDVDSARREADEAIAAWSQRGFHLQHLFDLFAQVQIDLYTGEAAAAFQRVSEKWGSIEHSGLMKVALNRVLAHELRARAAISCVTKEIELGGRARMLEIARSDAKTLVRVGGWASGMARLVLAQIAALEQNIAFATVEFDAAAKELDSADMPLQAAAARVAKALLLGDVEALAQARAPLHHQVKEVDRFIAMMAPWCTAQRTCAATSPSVLLRPSA